MGRRRSEARSRTRVIEIAAVLLSVQSKELDGVVRYVLLWYNTPWHGHLVSVWVWMNFLYHS